MRLHILVGTCALLVVSLATPAARADSAPAVPDESLFRCQKPKGKLRIEFKADLELKELVAWASAFSCKSLVVSSTVAGRRLSVNIISPKQISPSVAWSLFQISLRAMGLAIVKQGAVYSVIEAPEGKRAPLPLLRGKDKAGRSLVRSLVSAQYLSGAELAGVVSALKSKAGDVMALPGTEMVLVTDYADHIEKMAELLREVDRGHADNEGVYVVPIRHANVAEIASTVEAILGTLDGGQTPAPTAKAKSKRSKAKSSPPKSSGRARAIIADERTRSVVLIASPVAFARARSIIGRLDVEIDTQSSHIHMVDLDHADAEKLAATLNALVGTRPQTAAKSRTNRSAAQTGGGVLSVEGEVRVTHDEPTNSLLVLATMRDFLSLREVIRRLDSTRPQVYIEATIMEVSVSGDRSVGGSFHLGGEESGGTWLVGLQQEDLQSTNLATLVGSAGLLGGVFGQPLGGLESFLGQSIPSFGVLFQALATSRRANLLSSPRIMTSDNTAASIKVAERRREPGATTTVATGGTTQAVESVDAALTLKVTPHVNSSDDVRLEIELVLEEFLPSRSEALGSDKSSREITNTVVVRDQESVIIGGLMVERRVNTESKVPLLGDIPVLGYLFKSKRTDKEKRNLVVLLTPYVLDSTEDHDFIVRRALAERRDFIRAHMSLKAVEPRANIDYRKKTGLLERINQRAAEIEREKAVLENATPIADPPSEGPL